MAAEAGEGESRRARRARLRAEAGKADVKTERAQAVAARRGERAAVLAPGTLVWPHCPLPYVERGPNQPWVVVSARLDEQGVAVTYRLAPRWSGHGEQIIWAEGVTPLHKQVQ